MIGARILRVFSTLFYGLCLFASRPFTQEWNALYLWFYYLLAAALFLLSYFRFRTIYQNRILHGCGMVLSILPLLITPILYFQYKQTPAIAMVVGLVMLLQLGLPLALLLERKFGVRQDDGMT